MKKKLLFLSLFFLLTQSSITFSQTQDQSTFLLKKGIIVKGEFAKIESVDFNILNAVNYDEYRYYNTRAKVKIVRGPLIELISLKEMIASGVSYDTDFINSKIKTQPSPALHEIINEMEIGFGNRESINSEAKK